MPAPEVLPQMARLYTNSSWPTTATPLMGRVPTWPTMTLSSRETTFVRVFCTMMGSTTSSTWR